MVFPAGKWATWEASRRSRVTAWNKKHGTAGGKAQLGGNALGAAVAAGVVETPEEAESDYASPFLAAWDQGQAESAALARLGQPHEEQRLFERAAARALEEGDPPGVATLYAQLMAGSVTPKGPYGYEGATVMDPTLARQKARALFARSAGVSAAESVRLSKLTRFSPMARPYAFDATSSAFQRRTSYAPKVAGQSRPAIEASGALGPHAAALAARDVTVTGRAETGMLLVVGVAAFGVVYWLAKKKRG
jgi:hypothetical protein